MSLLRLSRPIAMCALAAGVFALSACRARGNSGASATETEGARRAAHIAEALRDSATSPTEPIARWLLPASLREISGVAIIDSGRMLVHSDEGAVVWEMDYRRGVLTRQFTVGSPAVKGDFEGITRVRDHFFLITSKGDLYEFAEGANGSHVPFVKHDSKLGKECEFEGIAYDQSIDAMLLACKHILDKRAEEGVRIYRWHLGAKEEFLSPLFIPIASFTEGRDWKQLRPTDIAIDPNTGNYVLVDAEQKALLVLTPQGQVVRAETLPEGHAQPEGVAVSSDRVLVVSDEANKRAATITLYRWQ